MSVLEQIAQVKNAPKTLDDQALNAKQDAEKSNPANNNEGNSFLSKFVSKAKVGIKDHFKQFAPAGSATNAVLSFFNDTDVKDTQAFGRTIAQKVNSQDETHTAIIVPTRNNYSANNLKSQKDALNQFVKSFKDRTKIPAGAVPNFVASDYKTDQQDTPSLAMYLSMPIYKNAQYSRNFTYSDEPFPGGHQITQFMCHNKRHFVFNGYISDITEAKQFPFTSTIYNRTKLLDLAAGVSGTMFTSAAGYLKTKAMDCIKQNKATSSIYNVGAQIDTLMDRFNTKFTDIRKMTKEEDKGLETSRLLDKTSSLTYVQIYLLIFDELASIGHLFDVYYCGLEYHNLAITSIKVNEESVNVTDKNVSLQVTIEMEQQQLASNISTTPTTNLPKKENKGVRTPSISKTQSGGGVFTIGTY